MSNLYYYKENGEEKGPFSLQELEAQHLTLDTQVLSPLTTGWQAAADLPELTSYFYKQGIYLIGEDNLAGFWLRLLAWIIDYVFLVILITILATLIGTFREDIIQANENGGSSAAVNIISILLFMTYHTICEVTPMRGSVGKYSCRLAVVNGFGMKETFRQALVRNFAKIFSSLAFGIGYLCVLWTPFKQGWHDQLAKTYVIRKPEGVR